MTISGLTENFHRVTETATHPLGTKGLTPASAADRSLYYVDSDGDVVGNANDYYKPAATDELVSVPKDSGNTEWIYVHNSSGSAIARGMGVSHLNNAAAYQVRAAPVNEPLKVVGIAAHTIPAGEFGWVISRGIVKVVAAAAVAVGAPVSPTTTAGKFDDNTTSAIAYHVGIALEAAAAADDLFLARVNCFAG